MCMWMHVHYDKNIITVWLLTLPHPSSFIIFWWLLLVCFSIIYYFANQNHSMYNKNIKISIRKHIYNIFVRYLLDSIFGLTLVETKVMEKCRLRFTHQVIRNPNLDKIVLSLLRFLFTLFPSHSFKLLITTDWGNLYIYSKKFKYTKIYRMHMICKKI